MTTLHDTDGAPVIVGGGIAGLMTALALAPQPVTLLTKAPLGFEASSVLAQGGITAQVVRAPAAGGGAALSVRNAAWWAAGLFAAVMALII